VFVLAPYEVNRYCIGDVKNRIATINIADNFMTWQHYVDPMKDNQGAADLSIQVMLMREFRTQNRHFSLHGSFNHWNIIILLGHLFIKYLSPIIESVKLKTICIRLG
jgi:hypothetical protein